MSTDAINRYWSLKPLDFTELEQFTVFQPLPSARGQPENTVYIVLRSRRRDPKERLHLRFFGVDQLSLKVGAYAYLSMLEIISIQDRHWERLKFSVHETENDSLRFYCEDFEAQIQIETEEISGLTYKP